ncbi:MAG: ECF transporter S component [Eubacteriales bacterium]|nr:ECF transporter S component [Eubacteriales bacterium]
MQTKTTQSIRRLTTAGVLAAAIILLTTLVSIPMPGGMGYINLGDAGVLLAGVLLGGWWGALCAGAASAISDILLGWGVYAPATFLIKGAVALAAGLLFSATKKQVRVVFLFAAALIVPLGYFLFETLMYGSAAAIPNVVFNVFQCLAGAGTAAALTAVLLKSKLFGQTGEFKPICAEILREPKNGPEVILIAKREYASAVLEAGNLLSVQGIMARVVAVDDSVAFDRLGKDQMERFLPEGTPFVRIENEETSPKAIMQAAREAIRS